MDGDAYESWVSGFDPATGQPRGRLRNDEHAVRFVEVTVNGPKSWSIAAELHPDVAVAYEAAQDRAAAQITGWLAGNATARVGPRGAQVAAPVELIEAATIRHYTSRAGDPHRHLHLQINSRVFDGREMAWSRHRRSARFVRMRSTGSGTRQSCATRNSGPRWPAHGYTLNTTGEIEQLAPFVGPVFETRRTDRGEYRPLRAGMDARRTPTNNRGPGCAERGTPAHGPRGARTRSSLNPARRSRPGGWPNSSRSVTATMTGRSSWRLPLRWTDRPRRGPPARSCSGSVRPGRHGTLPTFAARSSTCSPAPRSSPTRRSAASSPKTSPPARSRTPCR